MSSSPTGNNGMLTGRVVTVIFQLAIVALLVTGCATPVHHDHSTEAPERQDVVAAPDPEPVHATPVLELGAMPDLAGIIPQLAEKRVVFVGEKHNRFDHHLTQLEIIRRLHERHPLLAIGMEAFQQPFQHVLDDYIAGNLSERELLRNSEYFSRWRMDFRLYAPILRYAREHQLPVVALNLPAELTAKVAQAGFAALDEAERAQLPVEIDRSDTAYEQRLRKIFEQHPDSGRGFESFIDVQLLWDEGMAEQAADYLVTHPDYHMVILAGSGHLAWGSGIPQRLARRLPASSASVLNGWQGELRPEVADYILLPEVQALPPTGQFGVFLVPDDDVPTVENCMPDSPCTRAGLRRGDRFLSIDGEPVEDMTDLRLAMWDKQPGDTVILRVSRKRWFTATQELSYTIELR